MRSTVARVPEPRSRTSRFAAPSAWMVNPFSRITACPGAATKAIGCFANARDTVFSSAGGLPMIARSVSCPAIRRTISSRLPTCSFTLTFGFRFTKVTSSGGSRYSAVVTAPTRSVPAKTPCSVAISSPASRQVSRMRPA